MWVIEPKKKKKRKREKGKGKERRGEPKRGGERKN